jgi:hypothetical protein
MPLITGTQILEASDRGHRDVEVPEWGGEVRVLVLSGRERERFERDSIGPDGKAIPGFRQLLLVRTLANEAREPLFAEGDADALAEKSGAVLSRLFEVAMDVNGFSKKAEETAKGN